MAYSCYVRSEGRGVVEVEPTVTIRFDQLTTITRNRIRRVLQNNYNPYGWSSKPRAVITAMQGHYKVFGSLLEPELMSHPDFDEELFKAKALMIGYEFQIYKHRNPRTYKNGYGFLTYKGERGWDDHQSQVKQMNKLKEDTLLPIARSLIDHAKLAPILHALENREPYTFTGINMR